MHTARHRGHPHRLTLLSSGGTLCLTLAPFLVPLNSLAAEPASPHATSMSPACLHAHKPAISPL